MSPNRKLPYIFDLLWDVKDLEQVQRIADGKADCSDATPEDLVKVFIGQNIPIPECLSEFYTKAPECHSKDVYYAAVLKWNPAEQRMDYVSVTSGVCHTCKEVGIPKVTD